MKQIQFLAHHRLTTVLVYFTVAFVGTASVISGPALAKLYGAAALLLGTGAMAFTIRRWQRRSPPTEGEEEAGREPERLKLGVNILLTLMNAMMIAVLARNLTG